MRLARAIGVALVVVGVLSACASLEGSHTGEQPGQGVGEYHGGDHLGFRDGLCRASPVHSHGGAVGPRIPWTEAEGSEGLISGHLFFDPADGALETGESMQIPVGGRTPSGNTTKILWLVEGDERADMLDMTATHLGGEGTTTMRFRFPRTARTGRQQFPSIIDILEPGCWELELSAGAITGRVVIDVMPILGTGDPR